MSGKKGRSGRKPAPKTRVDRMLAESDSQLEEIWQGLVDLAKGVKIGTLTLPPCCKGDCICLIAMRRFDGCLMEPSECEFIVENADVDSHNAKKMPQSNISACRSADISRTE